MRIFLLFVLIGSLVGCAEMKPQEGMSLQELNQMSASSFHGDLRLADRQGEYEVYQSTGLGNNPFYIVKNGVLIKVADGSEVQNYINERNEMDRLHFANEADYKLGKNIGVDGLELQKLREHGINDSTGFKQLKAEFESNQSIYGSRFTVDSMLQYLQDKATATSKNQTVAQVVQDRNAAEAKALQHREREAAKQRAAAEAQAARERAEHAKEYPLEAVLTCKISDNQAPLQACFKAEYSDTELEINNGSEYHMYKFYDVHHAGQLTNEGLVIPLRRHFSLKAQNASNDFILTTLVRDTKTGKVLFQKSAARFGVISVRN